MKRKHPIASLLTRTLKHCGSWRRFVGLAIFLLAATNRLSAVDVIVTIENLAPPNGNFLTPVWMSFHNGGFDLFNIGGAASAGLESVAEDGATTALTSEFSASAAGAVQGTTAGGPIAPGQRRSMTVALDPTSARYLSFASMVIPSNDAFIGNENPMAHPVFDASGNFVGGSFVVAGSQVYDAGTEVNDELAVNTAFLGQTTANTGVNQSERVQLHGGFKAKGAGGILDAAMFANADFKAANYQIARITICRPVEVTVTIENLAPPNGSFLTPVWMSFHNGGFDLFNIGGAASTGLESVAEDGATTTLTSEFSASAAGTVQGTTAGGPIAPGQRRSMTVALDPTSVRYLSFASMVIPSNDAFIGNENPMAHPVFDANGNFVGGSFVAAGSHVYDAGTEMNDELSVNTAFLGQTTANTGVSQGGRVQLHGGFKAKGAGGILDAAMFANADFKAANYQVARVTISRPVEVTVTIENLAPPNGNFLTPVWMSFHNGSFDLFNIGGAASAGLESVAEDGATTALTSEFSASAAGTVQGTTAGGPIAPGQRRSMTVALDLPSARYLSFASMVIPSNDAFIGNENPMAHPVFDANGNFVGGSFVVAGSQVYDAGTEVNDELAVNTAFLGQTTANTGVSQGGRVQLHGGFKAKGAGGILDAVMFANADFKAASYQIARITVLNTIYLKSVAIDAGQANISWSGGSAPYTVQKKANLSDAEWLDALTTTEKSGAVRADTAAAFFRVTSQTPFAATLSGAAERPSVSTTASGSGAFWLDGNKLMLDVTYTGLSSAATAAHFHGPATTEQTAGVIVDLAPVHVGKFGASGRFVGSVTLSAEHIRQLASGLVYFNIHTGMNPGGELRGQVMDR